MAPFDGRYQLSEDDRQSVGGAAPSKVSIAGKHYVLYVKIDGEFMTVKQATKYLQKKKRSATSATKHSRN